MAFANSKNSVWRMDVLSGSSFHTLTMTDITNYVTGVDGLPGTVELTEVTTLNDSGRKFYGDVTKTHTISLNLLWSGDASSSGGGPNSIEDLFRGSGTGSPAWSEPGSTTTLSFEYSPDSTGSGKRKFTGECWISSISESARLGEMVTMDVELQVDGDVTIANH